MKNIAELNRSYNECCGCEACAYVCPANAIVRNLELKGEQIMSVSSQCVHCGKCVNICPVENRPVFSESTQIFSYKSTSKQTQMSSSGGAAFEIAKQFINDGSVVYGAIWSEKEQSVVHHRFSCVSELALMQGSKYVQSQLDDDIYDRIRVDLKSRRVLFIGMPCQVAAVINITKRPENLFCIDLLCHGVVSPALFSEQIKLFTTDVIRSVSFRDGLKFRLLLETENMTYWEDGYDNPYYSLYLSFTSLRESCYKCHYSSAYRCGDITLGDYVDDDGSGNSLVIINSNNGDMMFDMIKANGIIELANGEIVKHNTALFRPTIRTDKVDQFNKAYRKYGLKKAYIKCFRKLRYKRKIRKIVGNSSYETIRKLIKKFRTQWIERKDLR